MKTFLGFTTGLLVGALGICTLLATDKDNRELINMVGDKLDELDW